MQILSTLTALLLSIIAGTISMSFFAPAPPREQAGPAVAATSTEECAGYYALNLKLRSTGDAESYLHGSGCSLEPPMRGQSRSASASE